MLKKIVVLLVTIVSLVLGGVNTSFAAQMKKINVFVNNSQVHFQDAEPTYIENRTYLPVRAVSDALGSQMRWDSAKQAASLEKDGVVLTLALNSNFIFQEEAKKSIKTDLAAETKNEDKIKLSFDTKDASRYVVVRGTEVVYDGPESNYVDILKGETSLIYTVEAYREGALLESKQIRATRMETPAVLVNDRMLVPVKYVAQMMGADVQWNPGNDADVISIQQKIQPLNIFARK